MMRSLFIKVFNSFVGSSGGKEYEKKLVIAEWLLTMLTVVVIYLILSVFF